MGNKEDDQQRDGFHVPDCATSVGRAFWHRLADDMVAGTHALMLYDDTRQLVRQYSSIPVRLRAQSAAIRDRIEFDEAKFEAELQERPLEEFVTPGLRTLLERVIALEPVGETLMFEVLLSRTVDNFLTYLSDVIALLFKTRPETLRSDEQVTLKQVLEHPDLDAFVAWYADRRVSALSYKGLGDVESFIQKRFGLKLSDDEALRERLNELIAARNLIVHRRGIIDQRFIDAVGDKFGGVGDRIPATKFWTDRQMDAPSLVVRRFDALVAEKFELPFEPTDVPEYWPGGQWH